MANGNGSGSAGDFTVKEILTQFIMPTLEEMNGKLDKKAEISDLEKLEKRVDNLSKAASELPSLFNTVKDIETKLTSSEKIAQMIDEGLRASKSRGWSIRERVLGASVGIVSLLTLALNLFTNRK